MNEKEKREEESGRVPPLGESKRISSLGRFGECIETNRSHKGFKETPVSTIDLVKMLWALQKGKDMYGQNSGLNRKKSPFIRGERVSWCAE